MWAVFSVKFRCLNKKKNDFKWLLVQKKYKEKLKKGQRSSSFTYQWYIHTPANTNTDRVIRTYRWCKTVFRRDKTFSPQLFHSFHSDLMMGKWFEKFAKRRNLDEKFYFHLRIDAKCEITCNTWKNPQWVNEYTPENRLSDNYRESYLCKSVELNAQL